MRCCHPLGGLTCHGNGAIRNVSWVLPHPQGSSGHRQHPPPEVGTIQGLIGTALYGPSIHPQQQPDAYQTESRDPPGHLPLHLFYTNSHLCSPLPQTRACRGGNMQWGEETEITSGGSTSRLLSPSACLSPVSQERHHKEVAHGVTV